ncbi:MAG: ribonuclease R, partial [Gammaproteobacteria bacterium]
MVGRFFNEGGVAFVAPDNKRFHQDILIPGDAAAGAQHGQIVMVDIVRQPDWRRQPIGRVSEILGNHMAPGMEIDIAIRAYDLPHTWPETVLAETAGLGKTVRARDRAGRVDLRSLPLVTIDGEDARDFDDAVYCERTAHGWRLLVAIADVAHYVAPGSALDLEAHLRGTSVYFPDRVIPMLPEALSNGLCSLNPEVDRLCLVCEIDVGARGSVRSYQFRKALMRSAARLTYHEVNTIAVERQRALRNRYRALTPHLDELYALYRQLRRRRDARGAIDFESTETKIVFDAARKIERIVPTVRNDAHRLIEECMIAANVAAAEFLEKRGLPCLYRIHEPPAREKLDDLRTFLGELGLSLGGGTQPEPRDYAALLAETAERPDAHLIQTLMLRSLRLAVYNPVNAGHFGLAHGAYTHFTSPIRRYPDLLVHRAIHHLLEKKPASEFRYGAEQLRSLGDHCSLTERRADEATRDAVAWLK